jgi:hypothetical protein
MKKYTTIALTAVAFAAVACKDSTVVRPVDAPTVESLSGALTRSSLQPLATGVLAQDRSAVQGTPTYLVLAPIMGRDLYRIDTSEPRYVSETLGGNPDPGSFAGGGGFSAFYTAIRAANNLQKSLPSAADLTAGEKSAMNGFLRTMKALDYLRLIELRDTVGIPIQTDNPDEVTPVRCKEAVQAMIAAVLDSGLTDLQAAGAINLPFSLPGGFTTHGRNYTSVANFILFNRAVKGKLDVERAINRKSPSTAAATLAVAELTTALGAGPGAVPASHFSWGPYYHWVASGTEATANPISDSKIGLNPLVKDSVQAGDTRASKIVSRTSFSGGGISTSITCALCTASLANQESPLAILKDEELVLLRAQAYIELGQFANAAADINSVRTNYGLAPIATPATKAEAISAVLYEKRYSLLAEGPQRWIDLREYGRLNATYLRKELATDPFNAAFPLSRAELNARGLTVNPACTA